MSRLDSFIRRLQAQRACLEDAARRIADVDGPILELGLGNGRTYDHLRELFPARDIFVFDRAVNAHPACIPDEEHLILGDIHETLPNALARISTPAVLAHTDIGSGNEARNRALAKFIGSALPPLMVLGGLIVSDQDLSPPGWRLVDLPEGVAPGRYFMWEKPGGACEFACCAGCNALMAIRQ